jgi:hypothetical protein
VYRPGPLVAGHGGKLPGLSLSVVSAAAAAQLMVIDYCCWSWLVHNPSGVIDTRPREYVQINAPPIAARCGRVSNGVSSIINVLVRAFVRTYVYATVWLTSSQSK